MKHVWLILGVICWGAVIGMGLDGKHAEKDLEHLFWIGLIAFTVSKALSLLEKIAEKKEEAS